MQCIGLSYKIIYYLHLLHKRLYKLSPSDPQQQQ